LFLVGQTRLVRRITNNFLTGSIHIEVPVNPRWPYEVGEKYFPALECSGDFVSHPSPRVLRSDCFRVKREIVELFKYRLPS